MHEIHKESPSADHPASGKVQPRGSSAFFSQRKQGGGGGAVSKRVNLHKMGTQVTMTSRSLLDIVMVSNKDIVKPWGDLDLTISDHYLVYIVLDMNVPKPPPIYITTRSFKNCTADKFSVDITRVPWETVKLMASVDDRVDAFNNLFLTCLDNHATIKTLKLKRKSNPSIAAVIRERINTRNMLHKRARKSGSHEEWKANK